MRTVTVSCSLVGSFLVFTGANAERIGKVATYCEPAPGLTKKGVTSFFTHDLAQLTKDVIADGWALKVTP